VVFFELLGVVGGGVVMMGFPLVGLKIRRVFDCDTTTLAVAS